MAAGASIIEKHLTLRRVDGGPDAPFSLEPEELKNLVKVILQTEIIMGQPQSSAGNREVENIVFRKSLFVAKPIKRGEKFTKENVRSVRPGNGLPPKHLDEIIGKAASRDIAFAEPLDWSMVC
mgnify:FL=1